MGTIKLDPADLVDVLDKGSVRAKYSKKKVLASVKKKKKKPNISGSSKVTDILKAKKAPLGIAKKYGTDAKDEINEWLSTTSGFLEGFTQDVYGSPTKLYMYQIRYLEDGSFFIHIDKSRQCLPEGSMIYTPNGPTEIENLKSGDSVYSYNIKKRKVEVDEVDEAWESGIRKCQSFLTRVGNKVIAGENHPFLMRNFSWKKNKDLQHGDKLKNCFGKPGKVDPPKSKILLLAYFMTDGSTVRQPKFINNDKKLLEEFIEAVQSFDSFLEFRIVPKGNGFEIFPNCGHATSEKNSLHHLLIDWDLYGKRKEIKVLPNEVFSWNKKSIKLLLNRMFACDGWYSCPKGEVLGVGIGSSCREFAYQIQQLLWSLGIDSKVRRSSGAKYSTKCGTARDFWKVIVGYRRAVEKFYNHIGILTKQQIPLREFVQRSKINDRIIKVKKDEGKKLCFDISVKKNKNFIFEGLIVHNTGFSYVYSGRSLAKSHLETHHTSIFISINQEEANEKIVYARGLFDSMPLSVKKKCVVDNKHSLEFEDHSGRAQSRTRIISHAQREPRGKGGNVDIYLDEAAHYTWDQQIYVAAVPIITRGTGTLTIGSSPLGKKGVHYEIVAQDAFRRIYTYHKIWWWNCIDFVKRGYFKEANRKAPLMTTEERVARFGSEKIIGIFISMDLEQFQQEYELLHMDEAVSFFPIDLINQCVYEITIDDIFNLEDEYSEKLPFPIQEKYKDIDFCLYENLEDLQKAVQENKINPSLIAGYDVGRKKHAGELVIIEEIGSDPALQIVRHLKTFRNTKFKAQKAYLKSCLDGFPQLKLAIDEGGIGMDMSEELADYSWRTSPISFSNSWKEEVCSDVRIRLEESTLALPNKKEVKNQIHSIKRKVTESGRFMFDAEKNREHHGDVFWAIAMASSMGERPYRISLKILSKDTIPITTARIIPIDQKRVFGKIVKPKSKFPMDIRQLKQPDYISALHLKGQ